MKKVSFVLLFFAAFMATLPALCADALEIKRRELSNGLTVLHVERHNLPMVQAILLVKAGQIKEGKAGLSSLMAELLTEGTKTRTSAEISSEAEFMGASLRAEASADFTTVSLSVLKKDMEGGFALFADVALNPTFPEEEISRKKEITKGALKGMEEDPSYIAERAFYEHVYGAHPYGRPLQGYPGTIDSISREDIVLFHGEYFRPNNSIVAVVGDLTPEELDSLIKMHMGPEKWPGGLVPEAPAHFIPPPERKLVLIERDLTQANIVMGKIGLRRDSPDYYAVSVMNYILGGGGFSSRLMGSIRDAMGLAYDVYSLFSSNKEPGVFEAGLQTKNESANTAIRELLRQIKRMRTEEVTDEELSDAKAYLTGSFPLRLDTMGRIARFVSQAEFHGLGLDYAERYPEYINGVTKKDVLEAAVKYLEPSALSLVVVGRQEKANIGY